MEANYKKHEKLELFTRAVGDNRAMTLEKLGLAVEKFFGFGNILEPLTDELCEGLIDRPELQGNLDEALFAVSESVGWPDCVDSVSAEQALMCWAIVEKLRTETFPKELHP